MACPAAGWTGHRPFTSDHEDRRVSLLRSSAAPPPRTLVDVFRVTVAQFGEATALDTGADALTYEEFAEAADEVADELAAIGVGRGDKVGVRLSSGTTDLYIAIMATLLVGAAYVPVDADDPEERARLVFGEADVAAVIGTDLAVDPRRPGPPREREEPSVDDDAWVIFTSGSTGTPKGVAVTHRNAAAFVDAESRLFLQRAPLGPQDRVMAGLSVAFDASCEEMWLAWRYGGCLVPAPTGAGPQRHGRRAVAGCQPGHRRVDRADPGVAVAGRGPRAGPAADPRRRGAAARGRRPPGPRGPRGLEHLRADRGDGRGLRRPGHRRRAGPDRAAARRLGPGGGGRRRRAGPRGCDR